MRYPKRITWGNSIIFSISIYLFSICIIFITSTIQQQRRFIAKDMGLPVKSEWYWFGLTFEKEVKQSKLRVLLTKGNE